MFKKFSDYFKYKKQDKKEFITLLNNLVQDISIAEHDFMELFSNKNAYIDVRTVNDWKNKHSKTHDCASSYLDGGMIEKKKLPKSYESPLKRIVALYGMVDKRRSEHNKIILFDGKEEALSAFGKICKNATPTEYQLDAILGNDKRILLTGSPSTGKTTALLAKKAYLIQKGKNVLYLDADKISDFTSLSINILTKLGEKMEYTKSSKNFLYEYILEFINNNIDNPSYRGRLIDYYFNFHSFGKTIFDFNKQADYEKYLSLYPPITLNGEKVKSYEELTIANFLYSIGVNYEYNAPFSKDVMLQGARSRYKSDFTLPDYNICINIYNLDADKNAPFEDDGITSVDGLGNATNFLNNRILEIRNLHSESEIPLIECYTYEKLNGNLLPHLQSELSSHGVTFNIKSDKELLAKITESDKNVIPILAESIRLSIETMLSTGESEDTILTLSRTKSKTTAALYKRRERMMSLILPFYNYYLKNIKWDDYRLIRYAANKLNIAKTDNNEFYLLLDNAENLNAASALLIMKIAEKCNCKITFAGCGWCSSIGISGVDFVYFQDFGRFFPGYDEIQFNKFFNLPYDISNSLIKFALNDTGNQEYKTISDKKNTGKFSGKINISTISLIDLLNEIPKDSNVLVASRYEQENMLNKSLIENKTFNCKITCKTIFDINEKFDYVIWTSTKYTDFGFPDERICLNNISDLILRRPDTKFFLGERNILCKAISLTSDSFIFLCDGYNVSDYVLEITK